VLNLPAPGGSITGKERGRLVRSRGPGNGVGYGGAKKVKSASEPGPPPIQQRGEEGQKENEGTTKRSFKITRKTSRAVGGKGANGGNRKKKAWHSWIKNRSNRNRYLLHHLDTGKHTK